MCARLNTLRDGRRSLVGKGAHFDRQHKSRNSTGTKVDDVSLIEAFVAKPEGEVICTYPPSKKSELFYTDLLKQAAQSRKGRAFSPAAQGRPARMRRYVSRPRPAGGPCRH